METHFTGVPSAMKPWLTVLLMTSCLNLALAKKKNVLFLVVDDLRPQLGCYKGSDFPSPVHPKIHSPNLDALAKRSLLLKRAYVQQALCAPSRTSVLTGRRPDTTRVHDLYHYFREEGGDFTTIPQYFKENGYVSVGMGKVFHHGPSSGYNDPISWSEKYFTPNQAHWESRMHTSWYAANDAEVIEHPLEDMQIAQHAVETLQRLGPEAQAGEQPFFIAVGFHRPHLPFMVPGSFFEYYPLEDVRLPPNPYAPVDMPEIAWAYNAELRHYNDFQDRKLYENINSTLPDDVVLNLRRAYYSSVTYTDSLIGKVLDELDRLGLRDDTIISFWSDHGWQLGEHGAWCKGTNFELANHTPMMVSVPGITDEGIVTEALTEFVDLFPTLAEAAHLPKIPLCPEISTDVKVCTEGISFMPLMFNPWRPWKKAAFSQYPRTNYINGDVIMGYSIGTDTYRYTEWLVYDDTRYTPTSKIHSEELYDHEIDPEENVNRCGERSYYATKAELHNLLHKGWRGALPDLH